MIVITDKMSYPFVVVEDLTSMDKGIVVGSKKTH